MPNQVRYVISENVPEIETCRWNVHLIAIVLVVELATRWVISPLVGSVSSYAAIAFVVGMLHGIHTRWGLSLGALAVGALFGQWAIGVSSAISMFIAVTVS